MAHPESVAKPHSLTWRHTSELANFARMWLRVFSVLSSSSPREAELSGEDPVQGPFGWKTTLMALLALLSTPAATASR
jgi:hypothetical protein